MKPLDRHQVFDRLDQRRQPYQNGYLAMYSSLLDGVVTDPLLMTLPIDDHMVHRGDGVFETFKCVNGAVYNLEAHLDRLIGSAAGLALPLPQAPAEIRRRVLETLRVAGTGNSLVRVFISRGPGSFGVNPDDCPVTGLYIVVTTLPPSFMTTHPEGAVVITSAIPVKPPLLASLKSCNYLPNVLMKREAVLAGADFAAGFDPDGFLTEGPTENIGIVTADGALVCPRLEGILSGTTMCRVMALAEALTGGDGILSAIRHDHIRREDILRAREMLVFGTTTDVTRVRRFDAQDLPSPRPVFERLSALLQADILNSPTHRTLVGPDAG